jgi:iron uptake system EfeUOB component EfeO/EfeM
MAANMIEIDGVQHDIDGMDDKHKYLAAQIDAMNRKIANLQFEMDQVMMAKQGFINALVAGLATPEEE